MIVIDILGRTGTVIDQTASIVRFRQDNGSIVQVPAWAARPA